MAGGAARVGRTTVRIRGFDAYVKRAQSAAVAQARASLMQRSGVILDDARSKWPVETGRSRAGLEPPRIVVSGDRVRLTVRNSVDYSANVRIRAQRGLRAWDVLVREPIRRIALQARSIAKEIGAAIRRRR